MSERYGSEWAAKIDADYAAWLHAHPEIAAKAERWRQAIIDEWACSGRAPVLFGTRPPDAIRPRVGESFDEWSDRIEREFGQAA